MASNQDGRICLRIGEETYTSDNTDFGVEPADKPEKSIIMATDNYRRATNENLALSTSAKAFRRLRSKSNPLDLTTLEP